MSDKPQAKFSVGEVVILQPPHPSAKHLWGEETTVLAIHWSEDGMDAMGGYRSGWSYHCDISAPPPTDFPEDQHDQWVWCEYDLKKKYEGGDDFESLMESLTRELVE